MGFAQVQSVVERARQIVALLQGELTAVDREIDRTLEITSFLDRLLDAVLRFVDDVLRCLRGAADALSKVPRRTVVTTVVNMCARAIEIIARRLERIAKRLEQRRRRKRNELAERFERAVTGIQDKIIDLSGLLANAERVLNVLWQVAEALKPQEPWILKIDPKFFERLESGYLSPARQTLTAVNDRITAVSARRQQFTHTVDRIDAIRNELQSLQDTLGDLTAELRKRIADAQGFANAIEQKVKPILEEAGSTISDIPVIGALFRGAVAVADKISEWCDRIVDGLEFLFGRELSEALGSSVSKLEGFFKQVDDLAAEVEALVQQIDQLVRELEDKASSAAAIMEVVLRILEELTLGKVDIERRLPQAVKDFLKWARRRREEAGTVSEDELPEFLRRLLKELRARQPVFIPPRLGSPLGQFAADPYRHSLAFARRIDELIHRVESTEANLRSALIDLLRKLVSAANELDEQLRPFAPNPPEPTEEDFASLTALAARAATIGELCGSTGLFLAAELKGFDDHDRLPPRQDGAR